MENSSQTVHIGLGNSNSKPKQVSPSNSWCFTLNNYTDDEFSSLVHLLETVEIYFYVIGKEIGENETPHLQGYIALKDIKKKFRMTRFENLCIRDGVKCMRCFKAKGNRFQNLDYCSKDGNYVTNIIKQKPAKVYEDWSNYKWALDLIEILKGDPDERTIYWIVGEQGKGKSAFMRYCVRFFNGIILNGSASNMKNGIIEYHKETGCYPRLVLSNIPFDKDLSRITYSGYEDIKDMLFYSGKYEGGMVEGPQPHFIIFANGYPDTENVKFKVIVI
jgi:hypothetical protein